MTQTSFRTAAGRIAAVVTAALATAASPALAAAAAPCVSAQPSAATLTDGAADAERGAPELTGVRASTNADCTVTVRVTSTNRDALLADDAILVYLNTDGDRQTGATSFGGADQGVGLVADEDGPGYLALLGRWDPKAEAIDFENAKELDNLLGDGFGFRAGIDEFGGRTGLTLGISVVALNEAGPSIALDFAPDNEGGALPLPLTFSTDLQVAPTAATPGTGPNAAAPTPEVRAQISRTTCKVPRLKGRTLASAHRALRASGCRIGRTRARRGTNIKANRAVGTLPATGTRIAATRPVTILLAK